MMKNNLLVDLFNIHHFFLLFFKLFKRMLHSCNRFDVFENFRNNMK